MALILNKFVSNNLPACDPLVNGISSPLSNFCGIGNFFWYKNKYKLLGNQISRVGRMTESFPATCGMRSRFAMHRHNSGSHQSTSFVLYRVPQLFHCPRFSPRNPHSLHTLILRILSISCTDLKIDRFCRDKHFSHLKLKNFFYPTTSWMIL